MSVISNSGPLIALYLGSAIELLEKLFPEIIIPKAVFNEVTVEGKPGAGFFKDRYPSKVREVLNPSLLELEGVAYGLGEFEVITLGKELNADLVLIDDQKARKIAKRLGLNVSGTIGILLSAKKKGIIGEIKPVIDKMRAAGVQISESLYRESLKLADEK